jgi:hypothetical protein
MYNNQKQTTRNIIIGGAIGAILFLLFNLSGLISPYIITSIVLFAGLLGAVYIYRGQVLNRSHQAEEKGKKWDSVFEKETENKD